MARKGVPTDALEVETIKRMRTTMRTRTLTGWRTTSAPSVPMTSNRNTLFGFRQPHRVGRAAA